MEEYDINGPLRCRRCGRATIDAVSLADGPYPETCPKTDGPHEWADDETAWDEVERS